MIDAASARVYGAAPVMGNTPGAYRKVRLMDAPAMKRATARMAQEIVESQGGTEGIVLIGIRTRGVPLARRLAEEFERLENARIPVGVLDITLYRDDFTTIGSQPVLRKTEIAFPVTDKRIVLVDDVLYTGRTIRAALDGIIDFGRPKEIQLAVLIDRGHRELPIRADYIGKSVQTSLDEFVQVQLADEDGEADAVYVGEIHKPAKPAKSRKH